MRKSWDSLQMVFLYQNSEREVAWDLEMNMNIVNNFNMSVWIEYEYLHTIKEPYILVGRSRWFWSETKNLKYPWDIHNPPKNPARVTNSPKTPFKMVQFLKTPQKYCTGKVHSFEGFLARNKGVFGLPVTMARFVSRLWIPHEHSKFTDLLQNRQLLTLTKKY